MKSRLTEALPFCGVSLLGSLMAGWPASLPDALAAWWSCAGAFFLLWFAFLFNNWQDWKADRQEGSARARLGFSPVANQALTLICAAASLALYAAAGRAAVLLPALAALVMAFFYSWGRLPAKQLPVISTLLHLLVADLVFLAGWLAAADFSWRAPVAGLFPGLLFAAGHLHHEALDFEKDRRAGVLTQAVRFGPARALRAGRVLWLLSPAPLVWFSWVENRLPESVGWVALLLTAAYLAASFHMLRSGVFPAPLKRLRSFYRLLYLLGGLALLIFLEPERMLWR